MPSRDEQHRLIGRQRERRRAHDLAAVGRPTPALSLLVDVAHRLLRRVDEVDRAALGEREIVGLDILRDDLLVAAGPYDTSASGRPAVRRTRRPSAPKRSARAPPVRSLNTRDAYARRPTCRSCCSPDRRKRRCRPCPSPGSPPTRRCRRPAPRACRDRSTRRPRRADRLPRPAAGAAAGAAAAARSAEAAARTLTPRHELREQCHVPRRAAAP